MGTRRTHCKRGHPLKGDNIKHTADGRRRCATCFKAYHEHLHSLWRQEQLARVGAPSDFPKGRRVLCKQGHLLTDDNIVLVKHSPCCRICADAKGRTKPASKPRRGASRGLRTHCQRGHAMSPENVYVFADGRKRTCLTCKRQADTAHQRRKADVRSALAQLSRNGSPTA